MIRILRGQIAAKPKVEKPVSYRDKAAYMREYYRRPGVAALFAERGRRLREWKKRMSDKDKDRAALVKWLYNVGCGPDRPEDVEWTEKSMAAARELKRLETLCKAAGVKTS